MTRAEVEAILAAPGDALMNVYPVTCPACRGSGDAGGNPSYGPCPECQGKGKVPASRAKAEPAPSPAPDIAGLEEELREMWDGWSGDLCERAIDALQRVAQERDAAIALFDRLKREAQIHADEARTANATIYEIYQVISGATGEPGNWHGAEPVHAYVAAAEARLSSAWDEGLEMAANKAWAVLHGHGSEVMSVRVPAAIRALKAPR